MATYRNREGVVVLLTDSTQRIAMQLRDNKPTLPAANQWGLFGGLLEPDERPEGAAQREIYEELNIELVAHKLIRYRKHYIPEQNLTTWVFLYRITNELENAILHEGQTWDFIGPDDERVSNIGLHHREIVLSFWNSLPSDQLGTC
jgi:8-oxo-dGTP pyrophosphatase MutT (NUDIX family)